MDSKLKAVRAGHKSAVKRLLRKTEDDSNLDNEESAELLETLIQKQKIISALDEDIMNSLKEEDIEEEILNADEYKFFLNTKIRHLRKTFANKLCTDNDIPPHDHALPSHTFENINQHKDQKKMLEEFENAENMEKHGSEFITQDSCIVFENKPLEMCVWPLRSIILECKQQKGTSQDMSVDYPCAIVSFIRIGRPSVSKSKLLNEILTDQYHNTFSNKDCPLGTAKRIISEGMVEAAWLTRCELLTDEEAFVYKSAKLKALKVLKHIPDTCLNLKQKVVPLQEIMEILEPETKRSAKLLVMGYPFEIMDGDVANVPLFWVRAVLKELKVILGEKATSFVCVGIQSSGKSTLLNTMFGLQFAKGLRAPELASQKHSHDNELATFVIGLGDVTIVNIKGENTAEMKDVLQIAVHAFLRLKLANEKLNMKQTCVFVHQNVPASDANDKMMQGRQKFVEVLDEMTREAAEQENVADIQSFNQVIDFDSEKNVWYFSDLWHGDPPMAPANLVTATV
ncbi:Interferon-induced very large GTPase 1 [Mytilus edulis]|uniref:Interferon-induced very large GTPase 1 n=1 Tax=Mytilus edulis TaxID=6550 RepID=A0A8S3Q742_MYTED|nr:Interferon-induced very large GTPase 1 [Mytilus edulis]